MSFAEIFKAYDVRGVVPDQLNVQLAHAIGVGFAEFVRAPTVLVGHDCRLSSPDLVQAVSSGITSPSSVTAVVPLVDASTMRFTPAAFAARQSVVVPSTCTR